MTDKFSGEQLAKYIDHTVLKADAMLEQVDMLCAEAMKYNFYSVCVNSTWTKRCAENLVGSEVKIAITIGFPLGAMNTESKAFEAKKAIENGADEIDMVINVGELKSGRHELVEKDINAVKDACGSQVLLKCIIETALLTDDEKVQACELAEEAGADFVKTSTGFSSAGATAADVALMRKTVGPDIGVKASGGVRTYEDAVAMIKAGANRLGTSASIAIINAAV